MISRESDGRLKLEIEPQCPDTKAFCEAIGSLVMHKKPFLLRARKRSRQITIQTGIGTVMSITIKREHLGAVCELLRREVSCTQLYSSGYAAGCVIAG